MRNTCLILCLICAFSSCKEKVPVKKMVRPVKSVKVGGNTFAGKSFPGVAEAEEYSFVHFRVGGMLQNLDVEEGQDLKKGQLIACLDPRECNLKVSSTFAAYQQAQSQMEHYGLLYEREVISEQKYETARTTFENCKAAYSQALNDLQDTRLIAPFSGKVEKKYVENHQEVQAGERIIKLVNPGEIQFCFVLPEIDACFITDEAVRFGIEPDVNEGTYYAAEVKSMISSSVDGSGISVILKINDPAYHPQLPKILPGSACNLKIEQSDAWTDQVPTLPLSCIYSDPESDFTSVWKVDESDCTVHLKPVVTGDRVGDKDIIILSGINPGDRIVTAGVAMLSEGETVKIID